MLDEFDNGSIIEMDRWYVHEFENNTAYQKYRVLITGGGAWSYAAITKLEFSFNASDPAGTTANRYNVI